MRKLKAMALLVLAAFFAAPAYATDLFPTIDYPQLPPVDYGLGSSFYLRGSAGASSPITSRPISKAAP